MKSIGEIVIEFRLYKDYWPLYFKHNGKLYDFTDPLIYQKTFNSTFDLQCLHSFCKTSDINGEFKTVSTKLVWLFHGDEFFEKLQEFLNET